MAGLISREELLAAQQKKCPRKPHLTLTEKYDSCRLADESPLSNESLHHHLLVNRCSDLGKPLHHHILMKSNTAFILDGRVPSGANKRRVFVVQPEAAFRWRLHA